MRSARKIPRGGLLVPVMLAAELLGPGAVAAPPPTGRENLKAKQ